MSNPNAFSDAEMARCFTCGHRGIEHAHGTGACFSVKKWAAPCSCPAFVAVDSQHDPVQRVLAKIDQGAPISRDEMHHAVHEAAHRRTPVAHRSTKGVTPAEMMEWPEMQALADLMHTPMTWDGVPRSSITVDPIEDAWCMCGHGADDHRASGRGSCNACNAIGDACSDFKTEPDPIFDREPRPAPTREEIAAMAVHDALDIVSEPVRRPDGMLLLEDDLRAVLRHLRVAARNLPDVTERIAP